jgi:HEAT repeat protein
MGAKGTMACAVFVAALFPAPPAFPASPALESSQVSFEQATRDLASADPNTRMRAVQLLKATPYPEAAVPLAKVITDPEDDIQLQAIAAELNVFLAEKIVPRKRVGFVIEVRNKISAETAFSTGHSALGPRPVPMEVLAALRAGARDNNPRVALEALYAFGALAPITNARGGSVRRELLRASGPDLAAMLGAPDPAFRYAALRVITRVFEKRLGDEPIETTVGDAVITALNENDRGIRGGAIQALGAMRYKRAVQALTDLFQYYGKGDFAAASLDALARIAHPASAPLFTAALTAKNSTLKGTAIEGLARLGDTNNLAAIQAALGGERSEGVLLAGNFAAVLLSGASIDPLTDALQRPKFRDQVWQYLVEFGPGHTTAFSRQALDPDRRLRADVADILGLSGDPAALAIVEPMLKDQDPQVALAAERAVARLK